MTASTTVERIAAAAAAARAIAILLVIAVAATFAWSIWDQPAAHAATAVVAGGLAVAAVGGSIIGFARVRLIARLLFGSR